MTYIQLINAVLRRMREPEVASIGSDDYVNLIGDFVNDAKRTVEDAWNWNALRNSFSISTVSGTAAYALTDSENRCKIDTATNDTSNTFLLSRSPNWYQKEQLSATANSAPVYFIVTGTDASNDTEVTVYPTPDGVYALTVNTWLKQADLSDANDTLLVPHTPVIHLALAMSARERGEVGGQTAMELFALAHKTLSDAVALDSALNPTETIFETV